MRISRMLIAVCFTAAVALFLPTITHATTTYTFTGVPFNNSVNTTCPPTCRITGSITLAQPLPPNINLPLGQLAGSTSNFTPLSFSFTDGVTTATNQTCPTDNIFNANTDANGNITQYDINVCLNHGGSYFYLFYYPPEETLVGVNGTNNGASYQAYFEALGASGGTWLLSGATTLGELAAERAKTLLGAPYGYGGKGYDFLAKTYQGPPAISSGYNYYAADCATDAFLGLQFGTGVDCSGLVMWSYNTAFGATTQFALSSSGTNNNPIVYPGSNAQYLWNTVDVSESNLQPGDLMFFDFGHTGTKNHVAMYLGGDEVIQAPDCGELVELSSKAQLEQLSAFNTCGPSGTGPCFRRVSPPIINLKFVPSPDSPVSLAVTDPDGLTITANTFTFTPREVFREVANVLYYNDADQVFSPVLKSGAYLVKAFPKPGTSPTDVFSLTATAGGATVTLADNTALEDIPPLGYGIEATRGAIQPFIPVAIDIKPGSSSNPINLRSSGTIPVAILSNSAFDVLTQINISSITFGRTGTESSLSFCDSAGDDINGDGLPDLVCHFYTQKTDFQTANTTGILQGKTMNGELVRGTDSVRIISR